MFRFKRIVLLTLSLSSLFSLSYAERLSLIGEYVLPTSTMINGQPFGGISGIVYDPKQQRYYAISDTRNTESEGPARFYPLTITLDEKGIHQVTIEEVNYLLDSKGEFIANGDVDGEGIALLPNGDGIFWSSELGSGLRAADFSGNFIADYAAKIPAYYPTRDGDIGARNNNSFEGLSITPDKQYLFMAIEGALKQDGPKSSSINTSPARILKFSLDKEGVPTLVGEYLYNVDPIPIASKYGPSDNGISEILALNDHQLLLIERSGRSISEDNKTWTFNIRVYQVDLAQSSNIKGVESINQLEKIQILQPAQKEKVIDFSKLVDNPDNLEALTFGPEINGHKTLLFVSDNNFNPKQRTQFYLFIDDQDYLKNLTH